MVNSQSDFSPKFFVYVAISAIWLTFSGQNRGPCIRNPVYSKHEIETMILANEHEKYLGEPQLRRPQLGGPVEVLPNDLGRPPIAVWATNTLMCQFAAQWAIAIVGGK